ncbi:UNVERIFIED_CONTAM: hypothetical protein HDU68_007623 [Siphonaria sp. JEL0065]|nr:hypothetical protein HDU68_007623 [Siphonaria sp. JEL0065]
MVASSFKPHVILGTMTFGTGVGGRIADRAVIQEILNEFKAHGHTELDTARVYTQGNTEEVLNEVGVFDQGFAVHTKVAPGQGGGLEPEKLKQTVRTSLKALGVKSVPVLYLHAFDHDTPIIDTLKAVQELYEEGVFTEFGLSNFAAWQVTQVYYLAKENNYVLPTIYQGMYNALTRDVEKELFPALREFNIRFYAYNPLAGGLLSGHHKFDVDTEQGARFDPKTTQGKNYRERYWNAAYFDAVEHVKTAVEKHEGITLVNAAHRWIFHHSKIDQSKGDGVIIGVSSVKHAKENLKDSEDGPLPQDIVAAFDEAYSRTKSLQFNVCVGICPEFAMLGGGKDIPLPSSLRQSGFAMPKLLTFRRLERGNIGVFTTVQPTPFDAPLFVLTTTAGANAYETMALGDAAAQQKRLRSLLPIRVASTKFPSFGVDALLAPQSALRSDAEFAAADMYGHRFSVYISQPPGASLESPVARYSYYATDFIFVRAQLHGTLLSPLAFVGDSELATNAASSRTSSLSHHASLSSLSSDSAFQMNLMSRKKKTNWTKEKYSVFGSAEASRSAFYAHYASQQAQQQQQLNQQRSTGYPGLSTANSFEFPSTSSLGRRPISQSSNYERSDWAQDWTDEAPVQSRPYSSSGYYESKPIGSIGNHGSQYNSPSSSYPSPSSTSSSSSSSQFARKDMQRNSGFFQRSSFPRGGPGNVPMPSPQSQQPQRSFSLPIDKNRFDQIYSQQPSASQPQQPQQQQQHFQQSSPSPVFGVIHLSDESISLSEADGLRDLAVLVATVYATWSRSILKPLEKLEYQYFQRSS